MIWPVEDRLTVTVLASISVNMNSPPSKSPFRYNSALGERVTGSEPTQSYQSKKRATAGVSSPRRTCSLGRCRPEAPSSTRWPRGPADSCRRGWGGSGHSCGPAGLSMDTQHSKVNKRRRPSACGARDFRKHCQSGSKTAQGLFSALCEMNVCVCVRVRDL